MCATNLPPQTLQSISLLIHPIPLGILSAAFHALSVAAVVRTAFRAGFRELNSMLSPTGPVNRAACFRTNRFGDAGFRGSPGSCWPGGRLSRYMFLMLGISAFCLPGVLNPGKEATVNRGNQNEGFAVSLGLF